MKLGMVRKKNYHLLISYSDLLCMTYYKGCAEVTDTVIS